jgi:putative effector of murein hydrolase
MPDFAGLHQFWVYLAASPLLGLTMTLCAYLAAQRIGAWCKGAPIANPVAIAIAIVVSILSLSDMSYERYFAGAQFVHFLLGPATVALAVPLVRQLPRLRQHWLPLTAALLAGCVTAIVSVVVVAQWLGATPALIATLAPKSVTSPIAMAVAQRLGGLPSLTAALVIGTGIFGAENMAPKAAHGIGTARAFQLSPEMGAFAGLAMGLNGALTALLAPWLVPLVTRWMG